MPGNHHLRLLVPRMQHPRQRMKRLPNSMPSKLRRNRKVHTLVRLLYEFMYRAPNTAKVLPWSAGFYACFECGVGEGAERATFVVYIADKEGLGSIAVIAVEVNSYVDIDDISVFEGASGESVGAYLRNEEGRYSSGIPWTIMLLTLNKLSLAQSFS